MKYLIVVLLVFFASTQYLEQGSRGREIASLSATVDFDMNEEIESVKTLISMILDSYTLNEKVTVGVRSWDGYTLFQVFYRPVERNQIFGPADIRVQNLKVLLHERAIARRSQGIKTYYAIDFIPR